MAPNPPITFNLAARLFGARSHFNAHWFIVNKAAISASAAILLITLSGCGAPPENAAIENTGEQMSANMVEKAEAMEEKVAMESNAMAADMIGNGSADVESGNGQTDTDSALDGTNN